MDAQALKQGRCSLVAEALRTWGGIEDPGHGVSMLPTLWPGDLLTVQSHRLEEIEPGEIVLYRRRNRFFIHRAVSKCLIGDGLLLIARGDSMPGADPPVRIGQVLGKITVMEAYPCSAGHTLAYISPHGAKDLPVCSSCSHVGTCTRCPGLAYMEGSMRGPSTADCEKSFHRTGVRSANMLRRSKEKDHDHARQSAAGPLIQIQSAVA